MESFGYELEFNGGILEKISEKYHIPYYKKAEETAYDEYQLKTEVGITKRIDLNGKIIRVGGEFISPILTDYKVALNELKKWLLILKNEGCFIMTNSLNTGFHIHLDRSCIEDFENLEKALKFLYAFQPEIYSFSKGDQRKIRESIYFDVKPLTPFLVKGILKTGEIAPLKRKGYCICITHDTLELRYFNSSFDLSVLDSYFQFAFHLRDYIANEASDLDELNYYYRKALRRKDNFSLNLKRQKTMNELLDL